MLHDIKRIVLGKVSDEQTDEGHKYSIYTIEAHTSNGDRITIHLFGKKGGIEVIDDTEERLKEAMKMN
jgi:hypothetical protein